MKKLFLALFVLAGGAHFSLQILKILPTNPVSKYYTKLIKEYDTGFFPQKWLLFAPEPPKFSYRFHYRCYDGRKWSDWIDPVEKHLKSHHANRFSSDQYLVRFYKDSIRNLNNVHSQIGKDLNCLANNKDCYSRSLDILEKTSSYRKMTILVKDLCLDEGIKNIKTLGFRSLTIRPIAFSKRFKNANTKFTVRHYRDVSI